MVIKLSLPVGAEHHAAPLTGFLQQLDAFLVACNDPKKTHLVALKLSLRAAYSEYLQAVSSLASLKPRFSRGTVDGDRLFECYESGAGVDRQILAEVERVSCGYCPYCGLRLRLKPKSRSPDRDHFLPRSVFPEFSVFAPNLVLCCDDCNNVKGAQFKDAAGRELFLHPYFEPALKGQVLKAKAQIVRGTVQIAFSVDSSRILPGDVDKVVRHVNALGVLERMADEAGDQLRSLLSALVVDGGTVEQMHSGLVRLAKEERHSRPNSPVGLALEAVSEMEDLHSVWCVVRSTQQLLSI